VLQCLDTHQEALIAPLLWLFMTAVVLHWLPNVIATPPDSDPKEIPTRRHCHAVKQHYRKGTRRANAPQDGSICFHGLHHNFPINLQFMGHYIWSNAPTLVAQQQQMQLSTLHCKVATLLKGVDSLKRPIAHSTNH
jgi:hypothetical protein